MNFENFTIKSQEVVQQAVQLAHSAGNQAIEPVHLLQALMQKGESVIKFIFQKTGVDARMTEMQIDNAIENGATVEEDEELLIIKYQGYYYGNCSW